MEANTHQGIFRSKKLWIVLLVVGIGLSCLVISVIGIIYWNSRTTNNSNNLTAQSPTPTPTAQAVTCQAEPQNSVTEFTKYLAPKTQSGNKLLFFTYPVQDDPKQKVVMIYDATADKTIASTTIKAQDPILTEFRSNELVLDTQSGDIYYATIKNLNPVTDDGPDNCLVGTGGYEDGCRQTIYKTNLLNNSTQKIYQQDRSFQWTADLSNARIILRDIDNKGLLTYQQVNVNSQVVSKIAEFSGFGENFNYSEYSHIVLTPDCKLYDTYTQYTADVFNQTKILRTIDSFSGRSTDVNIPDIVSNALDGVIFSPDLKMLVYSYSTGTVIDHLAVYDIAQHKLLFNMPEAKPQNAYVLVDGQGKAYYQQDDNKIYQYSAASDTTEQMLSGLPVQLSADGVYMLVAQTNSTLAHDQFLVIYDIATHSTVSLKDMSNKLITGFDPRDEVYQWFVAE